MGVLASVESLHLVVERPRVLDVDNNLSLAQLQSHLQLDRLLLWLKGHLCVWKRGGGRGEEGRLTADSDACFQTLLLLVDFLPLHILLTIHPAFTPPLAYHGLLWLPRRSRSLLNSAPPSWWGSRPAVESDLVLKQGGRKWRRGTKRGREKDREIIKKSIITNLRSDV